MILYCLCEMKDPRYKATYNYINPAEPYQEPSDIPSIAIRGLGHGVTDVVPYVFGGNVRGVH